MSKDLYIISEEIVKELLSMGEAIDLMRNAFAELSSGNANIPERTHIGLPFENADSLIMPVHSDSLRKFGVKVVSLYENNYSKHLPMIQSMMMLFDSENGMPLAVLGSASLTAIRTGAASGLATDLLARNDSSTVAIFGSGIQARTQLEAVCSVRRIRDAMIFTKDVDSINAFIDEMTEKLGINIFYEKDLNNLSNADIICTATNSSTPLFDDSILKEGVHINVIGSYKPDVRETPSKTVARAKVVVDSGKNCLTEAGDIIIPINEGVITKDHIYAEIGELVSGKIGRINNSEITFFKSVGSAIQDLVCSVSIFEKAKKTGFAQIVKL